MEFRSKLPAMMDLLIGQIKHDHVESWIRVVGLIVAVKDDNLVLDDGTGTLKVNLLEKTTPMIEGTKVRVIGRLSTDEEEGLILNATHITRMSGINIEVYKQVVKLEQKLKSQKG